MGYVANVTQKPEKPSHMELPLVLESLRPPFEQAWASLVDDERRAAQLPLPSQRTTSQPRGSTA